jgi:hypothetical protein
MAIGADQPEDLVDLVVLDADEDRGVALLEEPARGVESRRAVFLLEERVDEGGGILVVDDGGDELHAAKYAIPSAPRPLFTRRRSSDDDAVRVRRGLLFWGIFFIALGAVPLVIRSGIVDESAAGDLWRLWPVGLIAIGVAIIVGRSGVALATTIVAALVLGILAGGALAVGDDWVGAVTGCGNRDEPPDATFEVDGDLATGSDVDVRFDCGELDLATAIGEAWRLDARYAGAQPDVEIADDQVRLGTPGGGPFAGSRRHEWQLELPTEPQINLDVEINGANARLGLFGARLGTFDLQTNAGDTVVDLAGAEAGDVELRANAGRLGMIVGQTAMTGRIQLNASALDLCAPEGTGLRLDTTGSVALGHNLDELGLDEADGVWTRIARDGAGTIALEIDGNAASVTLEGEGGCT